MRVLVVGGASSGKSKVAEEICVSLSRHRTYVATMRGEGAEARARIERHRRQREGLSFATVECPDTLACVTTGARESGVALLDDLGNLCANALFAPDGTMHKTGEVKARLASELVAFSDAFEHVVVVSCEVGSQGPSASASVNEWIRLVGGLSAFFASIADTVVEVVCGIPTFIKGEPWRL